MVEIKNLTKYYGHNCAVKGISFEIRDGEILGFLGPNGAGKSTTVRTLLGLISPTCGRAQVLGMDIGKNSRAILERTGYLPSGTAFYSGMRVREVLKLSADLRNRNCDKAAAALCERLQLDRDRKVEDLSFGNRKKVGIVCALQHDPELLILDEPTGGLDPLMQHEFFSILRERNEQGATVFLSSHILSEIQRHCSRAAVIREGKIIACDSVEKLAQTGARRVTLQGDLKPEDLPGVKDWKEQDGSVSFLYNGTTNQLI
ncbi:MAG: ABC transporter ATP-binding protein, partial [Oscillospiraceae bacterium]|nr:ABC transporter ATP-binding protein [Oscillospiraceae bacterium]